MTTGRVAGHGPLDDRTIESLTVLVQNILRRKSGMSLAADDSRAHNEDARDLVGDVLEKVWMRVRQEDGSTRSISDLRAYAATIAHNEWSDYLRRRYPKRASLKNKLRYFLNHQPAYALWPDPQSGLVAGLKEHEQARLGDASERLQLLSRGEAALPPGSVAPKLVDRYEAADWDRLLRAIFRLTSGPAGLDELVTTVATLLDLREDAEDSLDDPDSADDPEGPSREIEDADGLAPHELVELRDTLRHVWAAIVALRRDYRLTYLLNLPGPGKLRSDIGIFIIHDVATLDEIGQALALSDDEFERIFAVLPPDDALERPLHDAAAPDRFELLFALLPIPDEAIGAALGIPKQTVINRRKQALETLQRAMADRPRGRRPGAAPGRDGRPMKP